MWNSMTHLRIMITVITMMPSIVDFHAVDFHVVGFMLISLTSSYNQKEA
jgi:hypothetical protein